MGKMKPVQYTDYEDDDAMMDDDYDDADIDIDGDDEDMLHKEDTPMNYKRSWRDTEKYKEMRELYRLINDELYTGINDSDILENDY